MFSKIATVFPNNALSFVVLLQIAAFTSGKSTYLKAEKHPACDKNYCFLRSMNYPQALIDELVEKNLIGTVDDVGDSEGEGEREPPENNDCATRIFFDPIYEIIDHNNTVRYVVQTSDEANRVFRQKLRIEECVTPGIITESTANFDLESSFLNYYEFYCRQTIIDYSFLVISLDGQRIEAVKAKGGIPVCCKCMVEEKF